MSKENENVAKTQGVEVNETKSIQVTQDQLLQIGGNKQLASKMVEAMKKRKGLTGTFVFDLATMSI